MGKKKILFSLKIKKKRREIITCIMKRLVHWHPQKHPTVNNIMIHIILKEPRILPIFVLEKNHNYFVESDVAYAFVIDKLLNR